MLSDERVHWEYWMSHPYYKGIDVVNTLIHYLSLFKRGAILRRMESESFPHWSRRKAISRQEKNMHRFITSLDSIKPTEFQGLPREQCSNRTPIMDRYKHEHNPQSQYSARKNLQASTNYWIQLMTSCQIINKLYTMCRSLQPLANWTTWPNSIWVYWEQAMRLKQTERNTLV